MTRVRAERTQSSDKLSPSVVQVNLLDNDSAVIVAEKRGQLVFANPKARQWFTMDGEEPDLELMADVVQPADTFLELFSKEGQASFRIGNRRVEATSHYVPRPDAPQMVVVMRELGVARATPDMLDPLEALNILSTIGQIVSAKPRLDDMLDAVLTEIHAIIPFDVGEVTLWDEDLQVMRSRGRYGETAYFEAFDNTDGVYHIADSLSGWVARYRQPLLIADVSLRPDVRPKLTDYPFKSYVGVPLLVGDRFIGAIEVASRTRVAFDHEDMSLLRTIAGQIGIAIENARLGEVQTERIAELIGLQGLTGTLGNMDDRRGMFSQLANRIAGLMNVEMCGILLYDNDQGMLIGQLPFAGVPDSIASMCRIPISGENGTRTIFEQRETWYTNNVRGDDLVRQVGLLGLADAVGVRTTALARMAIGERRLGAVQVANKRDASGFSDNDMRLLAVFAAQVAIIIDNTRLFDQERRRDAELVGLQDISETIGSVGDPAELYGQITRRIAKLMDVHMCGILLYNVEIEQLVSEAPFFGIDNDVIRHYRLSVAKGTTFRDIFFNHPFWISNELRLDPIIREGGMDKLAMLVGIRQTMVVPMQINQRRVGIVQVSNRTQGDFAEEDARVLSIFAGQTVIILENARLIREVRRRTDESESLRRIAQVIVAEDTVDRVVAGVIAEIVRSLNCDVGAVALFDATTGALIIKPEWTAGMAGINVPYTIDTYAPGFQNSTVLTGRSFFSNNLRTDARVLPVYKGIAERYNFNAAMQVPLIIQERGIGEMTVGARRDSAFSPEDLRLLEAIGVQLASVLGRERLGNTTDDDLRARLRELDAVTRISNELNRTVEFGRILEVIRTEAQRTLYAEGSTVVIFRAPQAGEPEDEVQIERRVGGEAFGDSISPLEVKAIHARELVWEGSDKETTNGIAAPFFYGDQIIGVIQIWNSELPTYSAQNQDFVRTLANQAAIAYTNDLRYQEQLERAELLKQRGEQLSQIFELGRMLRSGESLEGVLEAVAYGVRETVGFNTVILSIVDDEKQVTRRVAQAGLPIQTWEAARQRENPLSFLDRFFRPEFQQSASYFVPSESADAVRSLPVIPSQTVNPYKGRDRWDAEDFLIVPLRGSNDELIGIMSVDDPRDGRRPALRTFQALETFGNQAAFAIENFRLVQAFQREADAARREAERLEQLYAVSSESQREGDLVTRLQVIADGIRAAGWENVAITLRDEDFEPMETITSGYNETELTAFKQNILPGSVWLQRFADPELRRYRLGQAYYLRHNDPWMTEKKLMAGLVEPVVQDEGAASPTKWHPLDTVYLPLYGVDRSRAIGIITMDTPTDGNIPTEAVMRPIELFAAQASATIENTRLYQAMITSAQQEQRINEVTEAIAATLDLDEIIRGVANGLQQMIPFTRMSFGLLPEGSDMLDILSVTISLRGEVDVREGTPIPLQGTALGAAMEGASPRVYHATNVARLEAEIDGSSPEGILTTQTAEIVPEYTDLTGWRAEGERTSLVVPMVAGGRAVGALHMGSELAQAFGFESQLSLIARIANLTGVAIENASLFQQTIDRERFASALSRVSQAVNAQIPAEQVLATILDEARELLNTRSAYIWTIGGDELVGTAGRGTNADRFNGLRIAIDEEDRLMRTVIAERQPIYLSPKTTPAEWRSPLITKIIPESHGKGVLGVPLVREERALGALIFIQEDVERRITDADLERASAFAVQAAIALESRRLSQEARELQSFNIAVIQSIQQGIVVLDRHMRIRTVNNFMQRVYNWGTESEGTHLFEYRPNYRSFLEEAIEDVLVTGSPEIRYNIRERADDGGYVVRNFYVYPLLQEGRVEGIVILVEDVSARTALEADIAARAQQLSVLTDVSSQLTALLKPSAVISVMFDELERILDYDSATLWLRREDKLVIEAARGYENAEALIGIEAEIADSELFRELAGRGQVLNIPDMTLDKRFPTFSEDHPMRSWLGVSLVSRGNLAGLLVLEKKEVTYYTDTMEQVALNFANQCAVALENAALFEETTRAAEENTLLYRDAANRAKELDQQTRRLGLLYRVSNALTQSIDLEDVFEVTLRETNQMLGSDRGTAYILEGADARLVIESPRGDTPPDKTALIVLKSSKIAEAIRTGMQPIVIRDVTHSPEYVDDPLLTNRPLSTVIVPLSVSGQLIGFLKFDSLSEYRDFDIEQVETSQTIASQAAIAVANANLLEQSLARARELETLFEATQSISATLNLDQVIQNIAMQMMVALNADGCEILNFNTAQEALEVAIDLRADNDPTAISPKGTIIPLTDYPIRRRAMQTRNTVMIRASDPALTKSERAMLKERDAASRVLLPMIVRDQSIGLIELEINDPNRTLTATEVRLARSLASGAAVAIENAGLQTVTASKLAELFVINDLSTSLAGVTEEKQIFDLVRTRLPQLVKSHTLALGIVESEDSQTLIYPLAIRDGQKIALESHLAGNDEVSFVMRQGMTQRLVGAEVAGVLKNQQITPRLMRNPKSFLGVPLIAGGRVLGALVAGDDENPYALSLDDQQVLSTVGAQIAVALQNARQFARTREFAAELERAVTQRTIELQRERDSIDFLYRLTSSLTMSLDINLTLNRALDMMVDAFNADMGVILGIDSISDNLTFRALYNLSEEVGRESGISTRDGLAGWMIQSHQGAVVPDVKNDYRWLQLGTWENAPRSAIGALLEANEDTLGVVMLYHTEPNHFTEAQLRILEAAATQIASAMNNADLYVLIRDQADRLAAMVRREQVDSTKNLAIVDSIADGVMVGSREGEITQFNTASERILGLPRKQIIGKHISALSGLYAAAGGQSWLEAIERWTNAPTEHRAGEEVRAQLALDNGRYVAVTLSPVTMGDQFLGTVTVFRDITREIEVDRMKSEFVATVSHELRTPMTSIKGYADLLLLGAAGKVTEQQQRFLSTIKTNADRLSVLVNELLDISRIDRGVVKLNLQPTDLMGIIDMSLNQIGERIRSEKKDVNVENTLPENLPLLRADPDKLLQIINHLVANAYSYTRVGGTIRLGAVPEERSVVITVTDTGVGIPKDKQDRIWERFYRDEEQTLVMETSGAGLGLSIVKEYVDLHNGQVWLESEVGEGTTFYIRIPAFTEN
ncbi:MAG TPA: GAF domain-containing protein [Aggregatilineales bacterium]|nr:GAF domain-containing protein [Anaerolineales bacterium]HRE46489.1 GAF domain-containing protein [Aggregatilineales bacterium]